MAPTTATTIHVVNIQQSQQIIVLFFWSGLTIFGLGFNMLEERPFSGGISWSSIFALSTLCP